MPKPVCLPCQRFFRPKTNGFRWIEGRPTKEERDGVSNRGKDANGWVPYKVWISDLWECQGCGAQIITGHAHNPLSEHYMDDFETWRASADSRQINDC